MTRTETQLGPALVHSELAERLRGIGVALLSCSAEGEILDRPRVRRHRS